MLRPFAATIVVLTSVTVAEASCVARSSGGAQYAVCEFDAGTDEISLFLNDEAGTPFRHFANLDAALALNGKRLAFAMNAGMYHADRTPAGFHVENFAELKKLSIKDGPGNFHLKPNGVFWISDDGEGAVSAHVATTEAYQETAHSVREATQSGPMLVIDGELHPRFLAESASRKRRNGVGIFNDGAVVFVISDTLVTFHEFATFFRDELKAPNALYLDGAISRLHAPELSRSDPGVAMGPIIGVVVAATKKGADR